MELEVLLRILTLIIFLFCLIYWKISEKSAEKKKKKTQQASRLETRKIWFTYLIYAFIIIQLLGLPFLSFTNTDTLIGIGFVAVLLGALTCISARRTLGTNWAHGGEYQIKENQELITQGIYAYIRHPMYIGMFLMVTGSQLIVGSYLFFVFGIFLLWIMYTQAGKEEKLLIKHFGNDYTTYMKQSKMFIPLIW